MGGGHARSSCRLARAGAVASVLAAISGSPAAHATFPGENGRLAVSYRSTSCVDAHLRTMRPDGTRVRTLTRSPCGSSEPSMEQPDWSPDGRRLLVHEVENSEDPGRIGWLSASGSVRRTVPLAGISPAPRSENGHEPFVSARSPSFAPDGRSFCYVRYDTNSGVDQYSIWRARLDGTGDRRLGLGVRPRWSPTGRHIAYFRKAQASPDEVARELWLIDAQTGADVRRLATIAPGISPFVDWSPDGRRLLYPGPRGSREIWSVRTDGRSPRRHFRSDKSTIRAAVWSPNGRRIALVATRVVGTQPGGDPLEESSIRTVRADGSGLKRIWSSRDGSFAWPEISWRPRPR